jgi:hypothetical protein
MSSLLSIVTKIVEEVKKLNEVLKNTRISELCSKVYCLSKSLRKLAERDYDAFDILFFKPVIFEAGKEIRTSTLTVQLYSCSKKVYEIKVDESITIAELFNKIFDESKNIEEQLLSEIYATLHELVREIALSADLVKRVEEVERKVEEIRSKIEPDP